MRKVSRDTLAFCGVVLGLCSLPWVKVNLSPSVPVGLWLARPVPRQVTRGQVVLVPVPAKMRPWWPHPERLLLKPIAGMPGDQLSIADDRFYVNAEDYGPVYREALGQALPRIPAAMVIPEGTVCVASKVVGSQDCRYLGPVPVTSIQAVMMPLLTW